MKQLKIIGLKAKDYRTLEAVELTPDVMSNSLIRIIGEHGAGKSSTIDLFKIPLTGLSGNNTKENVGNGFASELQLTDGERKLFLGVKVEPLKKGENKGKENETWYLYEKDAEGKMKGVIVDGKEATASSFSKELSTSLTFNIPSLFTKNATEHRKVIEGMYSSELSKLGANEVVAEINKAREERDSKRALCGAVGAFMETFEAEGWTKESLGALQEVDLFKLQGEQTNLEVEKGGIITTAEAKTELNKKDAEAKREKDLGFIKETGVKVVAQIRALSDMMMAEYRTSLATYEDKAEKIKEVGGKMADFSGALAELTFMSESERQEIENQVQPKYDAYLTSIGALGKAPNKPIVATFGEDGLPVFPEGLDAGFEPMVKRRSEIASKYATLKNTPLVYDTVNPEDTAEIDKKITAKKAEIEKGRLTNALVARYNKWLDWMDACGLYDSLIDKLRKLYGQVNTGVEGLSIYPVESGRGVDIWLKYTGVEDKEFFRNDKLEPRFLWDYSATQQGAIGVMLQGAMLDKKPTAIRLAVIDEMPLTALGVKVMTSVTERYNVQLITTYADTHYSLDDVEKGVIVIENGRAFFNEEESGKN